MTDLFDRLRLFRGGGRGNQNEGSGNRRSGSWSPPDPDRSRIKRALFGPVDHEANRRFVEQELAKSQRQMTARYNFDFTNDRPLDGRWKWERLGASTSTTPLVNSDQVVPEAASATNSILSETDEQKENSGVVKSSSPPASNIASTSTASSSTTTTTASTSIPVISSTAVASCSSSANSSSPCDIMASAVSTAAAASANTSSCRSSSSSVKPICQKSSMSARHQSKKITEHFQQRKRSKSKVKTQERKPEGEQLSQPPTLSAATTAAVTKAE